MKLWFKKFFNETDKKSKECNPHRIGENMSFETYVWKGRESTPYKHYVEFRCEKCGKNVRLIKDDAQLTYEDTKRGIYN